MRRRRVAIAGAEAVLAGERCVRALPPPGPPCLCGPGLRVLLPEQRSDGASRCAVTSRVWPSSTSTPITAMAPRPFSMGATTCSTALSTPIRRRTTRILQAMRMKSAAGQGRVQTSICRSLPVPATRPSSTPISAWLSRPGTWRRGNRAVRRLGRAQGRSALKAHRHDRRIRADRRDLGKLALPTLIVQEGGYSLAAAADAAPAFVEAFRSASGA